MLIFVEVARTMCAMPTLNVRKRTDLRLSVAALKLIETLAKQLGIGKTHVIELAVRQMAESKGVK
jgi:hypothetical protein